MIVGFVSTRFHGLDGVTLEAAKVAHVIVAAGHDVVWFAGDLGPSFRPGVEFPPAHFATEANEAVQRSCFGVATVDAGTLATVDRLAAEIEEQLHHFVKEFGVDVLVSQNSSAIPMQLPLGLAVAQLVADGVPAVGHHHDFSWERERFRPNGVGAILEAAFPPRHAGMRHAVINSIAAAELQARRGVTSTVVPNVMDFEHPPPPADPVRFRDHLGLGDDRAIILQPTRVIRRKGIEDTITLAHRLGDATVVITHPEDEEEDYGAELRDAAARLDVDLRFTSVDDEGEPTLADAYAAAGLVAYPSRIEGFGNALLEAMYYRRPLLVRRYPVYLADIAPTGVRCIEIDDALNDDAVATARRWLAKPSAWQQAVDVNYEVCTRHFSYRALRERFLPLLG